MRPLNILHLRDTHQIGGPGKTILETYRAIDAERFQLHLGVFGAVESPFTTEAKRLGMPVHYIRGANQYDPRLITRIAELVRTLSVDIIHAHEVKSDVLGYLAARLCRVPIMTTLHGWIANGAKQRLFTALDKRIVKRFDLVIAVSRQIEEEMLTMGMSGEQLRLVHNAIVVERYRRTGVRGVLDEAVGRPVTSPVVASIGRLSREKGHADLIEAVVLVRNAGHKLSLVLVGDGPERQSLTRQITARGLENSVHLPGYIPEPQRLLEEVDLMVLPSHTEGLPNVALEALLMEVPVLATHVGGTPDVIIDGAYGRLVPACQPEALAAGIVEFLGNREAWRHMATSGRDFVKRSFDFRARTAKVEALYTDLAKAHGRPAA